MIGLGGEQGTNQSKAAKDVDLVGMLEGFQSAG